MSMSAGGGSGSVTSEPNVTPMIDVLLVLLIIFMAVLPSMRKAIDIQLPDPNPAIAPANSKSDQIVLEVDPGGKYSINTQEVTRADLATKLHAVYDGRPDKIIFIKGVPGDKYNDIIDAMDVARGAIGQHAVIGVPPKDTPGAAPAAAK